MYYKLIIGNNFINNNPKIVYLFDKEIFSIDKDDDGPYISCQITDNLNNDILIIKKNKITFNHNNLDIKKCDRDHLLVFCKKGEIILESRIVDKNTLIVSGIFSSGYFTCNITQNYILLSNGKRIMHSKIDSNGRDITISTEGIKKYNN
jgi:hypothetical protein